MLDVQHLPLVPKQHNTGRVLEVYQYRYEYVKVYGTHLSREQRD